MREVPGELLPRLPYTVTKDRLLCKIKEIRKALCSCYWKNQLCDDTTRAGMTMLPSAFILVEKEKGGYTIYGGGFGHGSGMSQNGAMEMAKSGKNYKDILKSYYHGIEIKNAN